jgi:hypothetical protein
VSGEIMPPREKNDGGHLAWRNKATDEVDNVRV